MKYRSAAPISQLKPATPLVVKVVALIAFELALFALYLYGFWLATE
jgi:hypothetical protein